MAHSSQYPIANYSNKGSTCCEVIEEAAIASRDKRANRRKPQPWLVRKLMIAIVAGLMGYAAYAYISRLCLPMIEKRAGVIGSRTTGIVLLVVFSILYLWIIWAYIKIILIPPGFARDHIKQSEQPPFAYSDPVHPDTYTSTSISHGQDAVPRDVEVVASDSSTVENLADTSQRHASDSRQPPTNIAGPSYDDLLRRDRASFSPPQQQDPNVGVFDTGLGIQDAAESPSTNAAHSNLNQTQLSTVRGDKLKKPKPLDAVHAAESSTTPTLNSRRRAEKQKKEADREKTLDNLNVFRNPPTTPFLLPANRYCYSDKIVKPYRTHHCRACGTCVLKYDHHCPWIGQCVGARNVKFFMNFCFATSVFTAFVFSTVLAFTIKSTHSFESDGLEPQLIILTALAAIFWLFTFALLVSNTNLIIHGQTTVESMHIRGMKDREERVLARGFGWWEFSAKKKRRKYFDREWGALSTEGNIWWRGNAYDEWVDVMGKNWLGWIFPISRSVSDGLSYPINPRFHSDGRWRRRSEWPEELR